MIDRTKLRNAILKYAPNDIDRKILLSDTYENFFYNIISDLIQWEDCTDENYWKGEYDLVKIDIGGEPYVFSKKECPYGWNVLVRNNAKILYTDFLFE